MFYYSIIFSIAILLFNSFGISKIYKRFFKSLEIVRAYTFGFLTSLVIFCLPLVPITLFKVSLTFLNYYFLVIQVFLLFIYIFNWRWFIISWNINYKKLLVFFVTFLAISVGWIFSNNLVNFHELKFDKDKNILDFLFLSNSNSNEIFLFNDQTNLIQRPLIYNLLISYLSLFKLNAYEIYLFINIFSLFTYVIFFSLVIMSVFYNSSFDNSITKNAFLFIFSFIVCILNMSLSRHYDIFIQFLLPLMILLIWLHYSKYNEISSVLSIILVNLISFTALSLNTYFVIPFTIVNLVNLGISYYTKKQKATDYNIFNLFIIVLSWSLLIIKIAYISIIIFLIACSFYIFYTFYRTSKIGMKINDKIDNFFYKWIVTIAGTIIFMILVSLVIYYSLEGDFSLIFEKWKIHAIFDISLQNNKMLFWVINVIYWVLNIFVLLYSIINIYTKRKNREEFMYMEFTLISILLFWNPFSLDLLDKILNYKIFNIQNTNTNYLILFIIPITPLFMNATKAFMNNKKKNIYNYGYLGTLSALSLGSIFMLNIL